MNVTKQKVDPGFMVKNESLHVLLKGPKAFGVPCAPIKNFSPLSWKNEWMCQ